MSVETKNMLKSWGGTFVSALIAALLLFSQQQVRFLLMLKHGQPLYLQVLCQCYQ